MAAGFEMVRLRRDYGLRSANVAEVNGELACVFLSIPPTEAGPGDVLLVRVGPAQLHVVILTPDGYLHADAGLRRVVEVPGAVHWPVLSAWRHPEGGRADSQRLPEIREGNLMATLVLTAVGTLFGGPVGGAIGAIVGQQVDQRLFAPKGRKGPRLGDLAVQTSSYGSQIAKIFGTMRVAGTVIWATDLREDRNKQGGGKGRPKTTTYSYSASFAVALCGRPVARVGRIWADGKVLRGGAGDLKTETKYRLHPGGERQPCDPLIAAAEGIASTPAYRGIAYAVFEDFQLGDYGNRIPSLTFEVVADEGGTDTGSIVEAVSERAVAAEGGAALTGFAAHGDSVRAVIATLGAAVAEPLFDDGERLVLGARGGAAATIAPELVGADGAAGEASRIAAGQVPDAVEIGYYDPARDYQAGLQRASHGGGGRRMDAVALPAAIEAGAAKALAAARLVHYWRTRERRTLSLPWSEIGIRPGHVVRIGAAGKAWLVTGWTLERMAVRLELTGHAGSRMATMPAAPGRAAPGRDLIHGPTTLHLFDPPELGDGPASAPRLLVAAAGVERGWRGATIEASSDGGASWQAADATAPAAVMGTAIGALGDGGSTLFDMRAGVEIVLLNEDMWLESRDDDALVAGANLAMLGDELIQFGRAEPVGPRRFLLSRLLRGRRGSEWAAASHEPGEPFTLIEAGSLTSVTLPLASLGGVAEIAARGIGDGDAPAVAAHAIGIEAVRPPSPVHLAAVRRADGGVTLSWTRRSRAGWAWIDGIDAPLGEPDEAYRVTISGGGRARVVEVAAPAFVYAAPEQAADGGGVGSALLVEVAQLGGLAPSRPSRLAIDAN